MPLTLSWQEIGIRLSLAALFSFIIGLNRDERGHPAGVRTTMLVCLAATLAQVQANLLLATAGKTPSSFSVLDLERLPLGILSGIGFIGAGVIMKHDAKISGVTTAATIWFVTVLGLLFGGGQLRLGIAGASLGISILWALGRIEGKCRRRHTGRLHILFSLPPDEESLRRQLKRDHYTIKQWAPAYRAPGELSELRCELAWADAGEREPRTPGPILDLTDWAQIASLLWEEQS
jgi:putative Mg2+ transporter-C (MgtC) family protein